MPTVHLMIKGKVQGVFYRASARTVAERMGVTGWIKNTKAGDVEAKATGNESQLKEFIGWCRKGPPQAAVTVVDVNPADDEKFDGFHIVR
jgi:acylphosphatase